MPLVRSKYQKALQIKSFAMFCFLISGPFKEHIFALYLISKTQESLWHKGKSVLLLCWRQKQNNFTVHLTAKVVPFFSQHFLCLQKWRREKYSKPHLENVVYQLFHPFQILRKTLFPGALVTRRSTYLSGYSTPNRILESETSLHFWNYKWLKEALTYNNKEGYNWASQSHANRTPLV